MKRLDQKGVEVYCMSIVCKAYCRVYLEISNQSSPLGLSPARKTLTSSLALDIHAFLHLSHHLSPGLSGEIGRLCKKQISLFENTVTFLNWIQKNDVFRGPEIHKQLQK